MRTSVMAERQKIVLAAPFEVVELLERLLDVSAATLEVRSPVVDLVQHVAQLARLTPRLVIQVDDRTDLLQQEAKSFTSQDQVQPSAVAAAVDAHGATPFRGDEAELLVVAHGSVSDAELVGNLRDRPGSRVARRCWVVRGRSVCRSVCRPTRCCWVARSTHQVHRGALVMFVRMLYVYVNVK